MRRHWRKIRYQFEWLAMLVLTTVVPLLPRRAVVALSITLGKIAFYFDRRGRTVALANLAAAFGAEYTPAQRREIAQASYCNFSRTMCDLFWSPALTAKNFHRYLKFENIAVLQQLQARGESAVMVCIHQGNFEWASLAVGFAGLPVTIVTAYFKNQQVSGFFQRRREVSGHRIIPQKSSMIRLLKHVRHGGVAGMLADLNRHPTQAATVINAFGMKMCVSLLHAVLVQRGPARLVPVEGHSAPDGSCRVIIHEPLVLSADASLQQITQACWDFFEPAIRAQPEDWMWNYRHWRYKPAAAKRPYPFYSCENGEFDRLISSTMSKM